MIIPNCSTTVMIINLKIKTTGKNIYFARTVSFQINREPVRIQILKKIVVCILQRGFGTKLVY